MSTVDGAVGRLTHRRAPTPTTVLAVSSLGVFMAFVDATIVNIAFPNIAQSFPDSGISTLSWVLNAYNIVFAAFLVAAGRIADLLGRRRMFLFGLVVFTLASGLCAAAPSAGALIGFRLIQALGAAFVVPASLGLVLQAFPADRRAHAVALLSAVGALAAGVGPSLGGLLVSISDWRLVFLVNIPVGIAAYYLSRRYLVESREPGRRRLPDLPGAMLFAIAVAALVLGVVKGEEWGWDSPRILGSFAVALALGGLFIRRCTRHRSPIIDLGLLRVRTFSVANSMTALAAAGFYGYTLINVLFLTQVWDYSVLKAGLAITPGPVVATAIAGPGSRLAERFGHRWILVAGGLTWGAGVVWFVERVGLQPDFTAEWLPGMIILGLGAGILFPNLSGAAVASAPGEAFATATGLNAVARQVGAALGVAAVVAILGSPNPLDPSSVENAFDNAWTFSAVCLLLAGVGCLGVSRLRSEDDVGQSPSLGSAARLVFAHAEPEAAPVRAATQRASRPVAARPITPRAESAADFLARAPIFAGLSTEVREQIARSSRDVRLTAGEWLFREGEEGDALFVIRAGRLEIVSGEGSVMRVLGRGAALGELALITSSPRSASARAARDTDLIAIDRDEFQDLLKRAPEVSLALTQTLGMQLRDSVGVMPQSRAVPVTIALLPLDERIPVREIGTDLSAALSAWGRVDTVDGSVVSEVSDRGEVAVFGPLLDRVEAANDQVVMVADPIGSRTPWTDFCLQHADRIVAIGSGGEVIDDGPLKEVLRGCDLVAWDVPAGSGALSDWATALDPIETHAIRETAVEADVTRMARRLAGRSVGIVLSGGGARAFAHIGVLEELDAAGLEIDRVAGVSMGAYIGGMFAMGMDPGEIDARCYEEWIRRNPIGDYTLPRRSLIRGDRAIAMLRRTFGGVMIEELPRGFFSGAAELRSGELVVSRWGPLWDAVATSFAIPVLGPAQVRGRRILVDGSLVDNLPVGEMAALGEGPVIAVDVKATVQRPPSASRQGENGGPSGAERELRTPSLGETLARVLLIGSSNTSENARRHADWTITPRSEGVGLLEFHQLDQAREAGRIAAREALEAVPEGLLA
ncbi:MAG TPA: DHA2 family efflux MFS transporter permease subunit [Solirubrobacterales bacterium]|nr:DHA2 family efflux MFS transporter permease subunit [Solirubrobacterales bacterium]